MAGADVAVIGAGVFGSWTAWHLGRSGAKVTLVEAWGPGHSRSSSGDESRIIRMSYGADEIYTRMSMRSMIAWNQLCERTGEPLFRKTGTLRIGLENDPYSDASRVSMTNAGVTFEVLSPGELQRRLPQFRLSNPNAIGIFEPDSGALMARRAVASVCADRGDRVEYKTVKIGSPSGGGRFKLPNVEAAQYVFACGAWLPKLFPDVLAKRIFPTRQEVFYFAPPPGDAQFMSGNLPIWLDITDPRCPYGFPDLESRGVKIAFDLHGEPFDPDSVDRFVSAERVHEMREFLGERFPALRNAPLNESRVCQYENTSNGDFLIDRHPHFDNVWICGGGSGHGFKHGPAVGEYTSAIVLGSGTPEPRFSLASKAEAPARSVY
jgi:sarcosine oxidase